METMTTALITSQRQNWNVRDNYWTYWMWWMMTSTKQTMKVMEKVTEKAISTMKMTKATHQTPKITEYPSYPHTSARMGAMANDYPHRIGLFHFFIDCCMCFLVRELEGVWWVYFCS